MSDIQFRTLEAKDIEVRVAQCNQKGCMLLLYKDARCDMRALDEAVGKEKWQCEYCEIKGNLFCRVGVECNGNWTWKQDVGIPSNMDAEKGEASDAFKRACFKWGIGRELYTAPFIWIASDKCNIFLNEKTHKYGCNDRFSVQSIEIEDGAIKELSIINNKTNQVVWNMSGKNVPDDKSQGLRKRTLEKLHELQLKADALGFEPDYVEYMAEAAYGKQPCDLTQEQLNELGINIKKTIENVETGDA